MEDKKTMGSSKNPDENSTDDRSEAAAVDVEEFVQVSAEIDSLNTALDNMESNVENIKDQLIAILMSNREILKELKEENKKSIEAEEGETKIEVTTTEKAEESKKMDTSA